MGVESQRRADIFVAQPLTDNPNVSNCHTASSALDASVDR
jgi:hypothetical protein